MWEIFCIEAIQLNLTNLKDSVLRIAEGKNDVSFVTFNRRPQKSATQSDRLNTDKIEARFISEHRL